MVTISGRFPEQAGICASCGHSHKLTEHHKIRRVDGGPNVAHNRVGVCRPCHDQIHGVGSGCTDCYPDPVAAQAASDAHWAVVRQWWTHLNHWRDAGRIKLAKPLSTWDRIVTTRMPPAPPRRYLEHEFNRESFFAMKIQAALVAVAKNKPS